MTPFAVLACLYFIFFVSREDFRHFPLSLTASFFFSYIRVFFFLCCSRNNRFPLPSVSCKTKKISQSSKKDSTFATQASKDFEFTLWISLARPVTHARRTSPQVTKTNTKITSCSKKSPRRLLAIYSGAQEGPVRPKLYQGTPLDAEAPFLVLSFLLQHESVLSQSSKTLLWFKLYYTWRESFNFIL